MKTLEGGWCVVINAYKFTVFEIGEIFLYYHILCVRAIPTLESTDSMIILTYIKGKAGVENSKAGVS